MTEASIALRCDAEGCAREARPGEALCAEHRARELVAGFFRGHPWKTDVWFETENPLLGYAKPNDLLALGKAEALLRFVEDALAGEGP